MSTMNFYLDREDKNGECPIFLVYQDKGRKFKHFTKEKSPLKYWDKKKQRVKHISAASEINDLLDHLAATLKKIEREHRMLDGGYSFDKVKSTFLNKNKDAKGLLEFFELVVSNMSGSYKRRTIMKYQTIINDLWDFEKDYKFPLSFDRVDAKFQDQFLKFLAEKKNNSRNTAAKKITNLKTLLDKATKAGVNKKMDYRDFKVKKVKTKKVVLSQDELFRLYEMDLTNNPKLEKVRDLFCFECFTGLRYSDIKELKFEDLFSETNVSGTKLYSVRINVQKNEGPLIVPLNQYAIKIIKKYEDKVDSALSTLNLPSAKHKIGNKVFPSISLQKMNDYIKELGKFAGIDRPINQTKYIGTERIDQIFPKYQLLSTHAARRTFINLSLKRGMRLEVAQKIAGHKSIQTTMKYVFTEEDEKVEEMGKAWG